LPFLPISLFLTEPMMKKFGENFMNLGI